eukprot:gene18103-89_t
MKRGISQVSNRSSDSFALSLTQPERNSSVERSSQSPPAQLPEQADVVSRVAKIESMLTELLARDKPSDKPGDKPKNPSPAPPAPRTFSENAAARAIQVSPASPASTQPKEAEKKAEPESGKEDEYLGQMRAILALSANPDELLRKLQKETSALPRGEYSPARPSISHVAGEDLYETKGGRVYNMLRDPPPMPCRRCGSKEHWSKYCTKDNRLGQNKCFNCGEYGHWIANCPAQPSTKCHICDEYGHWTKNCPRKPKPKPNSGGSKADAINSTLGALERLHGNLSKYIGSPPIPNAISPLSVLRAIEKANLNPPSTPSPSHPILPLRHQKTSAPPAAWIPLGQIGCHTLSTEAIDSAFLPSKAHPSPVPVRIRDPTQAEKDLVSDLRSHDLLRPVSEERLPTGSIHVTPKTATKSRAIFDLRHLNQEAPFKPRRFHLPTFNDIKDTAWLNPETPLWFTCIDLANFFFGLRLPPDFPDEFVFAHSQERLSMRCLPFGWNGSPFIAQTESSRIVTTALQHSNTFAPVYLDDILCVNPEPAPLALDTLSVIHALESDNHVIHTKKTKPIPATTITWIGKRISSQPRQGGRHTTVSIANTAETCLSTIAHTAIALCLPPTKIQHQKIAGAISWATCHHRLGLPFLNTLHRCTYPGGPEPTEAERMHDTMYAALISSLPWTGFGFHVLPGPRLLKVYCDGAHTPHGSDTGVFIPELGIARCTPIKVYDQQHSELISAIHAITLAARTHTSFELISDSESTLHTSPTGHAPYSGSHTLSASKGSAFGSLTSAGKTTRPTPSRGSSQGARPTSPLTPRPTKRANGGSPTPIQQLRNAVDVLKRAVYDPFSCPQSLAARARSDNTLNPYRSYLNSLAQHMERHSFHDPSEALTDMLFHRAQAKKGSTTLPGIVDAVQFANNLGLISVEITGVHRLMGKGTRRIKPLRERDWISLSTVHAIMDTELESPTFQILQCGFILSYFHYLRISEMLNLRTEDFGTDHVTLGPSKRRDYPVTEPLCPESKPWANRLLHLARSTYPDTKRNSALFRVTAPTVNRCLKILLSGTIHKDATHHCFRHGRTTQQLLDGIPMHDVQRAGRWKDIRSLQSYIHAELPKEVLHQIAPPKPATSRKTPVKQRNETPTKASKRTPAKQRKPTPKKTKKAKTPAKQVSAKKTKKK